MVKSLSVLVLLLLIPLNVYSSEKGMSISLYKQYSQVIEIFTSGNIVPIKNNKLGVFFVKVVQAEEHSGLITYIGLSSPSDANAELYNLGNLGSCTEAEWENKTSLWLTCKNDDNKLKMHHFSFSINSGFFSMVHT